MKKTCLFLVLSVLFFACGERPEEIFLNNIDNADSLAYIATVFDYQYAPGQHATTVYSAAPANFVGKPSYLQTTTVVSKPPISLGGWGGFIVGGFRQDVVNGEGNDFIVFCGSSPAPEPAVVYVMADENDNGVPDDTWYELRGSETGNQATVQHYELTYSKPFSANENVRWHDNQGNSGELKNGYETGNTAAWWKNSEVEAVVFAGTRLPDAYVNQNVSGVENWVVRPELFAWGYAENGKGTDYNATLRGNEFDIANAIDAAGNSVSLVVIRFVKIQTGVFQQAGWLNEISTEVFGAADLRLLKIGHTD